MRYKRSVYMAKSPITPQVESYLKLNHKLFTHKKLAEEIGCCLETVRRALVRLDLEVIYGAKYQRRAAPLKWSRPCITCGCRKKRPKMQFKCAACHDRERDADKHQPCKREVTVTLPRLELCPVKKLRVTTMSENLQSG